MIPLAIRPKVLRDDGITYSGMISEEVAAELIAAACILHAARAGLGPYQTHAYAAVYSTDAGRGANEEVEGGGFEPDEALVRRLRAIRSALGPKGLCREASSRRGACLLVELDGAYGEGTPATARLVMAERAKALLPHLEALERRYGDKVAREPTEGGMDVIEVDYRQPPEGERFDVRKGTFLAVARFPIDAKERPMRYRIVAEVPAEDLYRDAEEPVPTGPAKTSEISDSLVRAFDRSGRRDPQGWQCLYMFRAEDGRLVNQHST